MKTKTFLVPFIAFLAILLVGFVSSANVASRITTTFNDVVLDVNAPTMAGITGETVPVRVYFNAAINAEDVKVKIWMDGFRDDVEASTGRFSVIDGSTYSKLLSLTIPSDLKQLSKTFTLKVSISNGEDSSEGNYSIRVQRDDYVSDVLSVDFNSKVSAGETFPVTVVTKNVGMQEFSDGYVIVSIPSLGISTRAYLGDLVAIENCSDDCNKEDTTQKTVYLKVPESATAGLYEVVVRVYNKDSVNTVSKTISVEDSVSTSLITAVKSQDMKIGETKKYDLIIVNSGKGIKVYNIQTVSGKDLSVSAPTVVTVSSDSSTTIPITVSALSESELGVHTFSVNVNGQVVTFNANVVAGSVSMSNSVLALTVILVIIFVVLLIVLIVLMTRKGKQPEQVETSYY